MLDAASFDALWSIYDQTGVRPEYLLPVLYIESGLDPSIPNRAGYPYYGINQASTSWIAQYAGTDPQTYLTWPASRQLDTVVRGMLGSLVNTYGPLRSGIRVYQANFLPATLSKATALSDVIAARGDPFYGPNAGLDANQDGEITLGDLATVVGRAANAAAVQSAIADAYQVRPSESLQDPVFGTDFGRVVAPSAGMVLAVAAATGLGIYVALENPFGWRWLGPQRGRSRLLPRWL